MSQQIGAQLGNYRLIRLLGQGGFADVYLGDHLYLKRQAAIKLLRTSLGEQQRANFLLEAQRLVDLHHPHIVRVLDFAIEGTTPFLVMEYAPNGTLRSRHPEGTRLPLATVVAYTQDIASALQHLHQQKLIHRDIKPENILLGRSNELLLSDLGIAGVAHGTRSLEFQGQIGTVAYMAPEQIRGRPRPASDQYALGVMVYEWLCGERPFVGDLSEMAIQHVMASPTPLHTRVPGLQETVETVVQRALEKEPTQRFESVQDFADALQQAASSQQGDQRRNTSPRIRRTSALAPPVELVPLSRSEEEKSATTVYRTISTQQASEQNILSASSLVSLGHKNGGNSSLLPEKLASNGEEREGRRAEGDTQSPTGPQFGRAPLELKGGNQRKRLLGGVLGVLALMIALGGGFIWWQLPHPMITINSPYYQGALPAGAAGTSLQVQGAHFASRSDIVILLDGVVVRGGETVHSDEDGTLAVALPITDAWPLGKHTLIARDKSSYFEETQAFIEIVAPGEANTPGPAGAPPDDFTGNIIATIQFAGDETKTIELNINPQSGSRGGRVCGSSDDGKVHTNTVKPNGVTVYGTTVGVCSGVYKSGELTYVETLTSDKAVSSTGELICTARVPYVALRLQGTFKNNTTIMGTVTSDTITLDCSNEGTIVNEAKHGTWSGVAQIQS